MFPARTEHPTVAYILCWVVPTFPYPHDSPSPNRLPTVVYLSGIVRSRGRKKEDADYAKPNRNCH